MQKYQIKRVGYQMRTTQRSFQISSKLLWYHGMIVFCFEMIYVSSLKKYRKLFAMDHVPWNNEFLVYSLYHQRRVLLTTILKTFDFPQFSTSTKRKQNLMDEIFQRVNFLVHFPDCRISFSDIFLNY